MLGLLHTRATVHARMAAVGRRSSKLEFEIELEGGENEVGGYDRVSTSSKYNTNRKEKKSSGGIMSRLFSKKSKT